MGSIKQKKTKADANSSIVTENGSNYCQTLGESLMKKRLKKSYSALTGMLPSRKGAEVIHYESALEMDFAIILEYSNCVERYLDHPYTLSYYANGKKRHYTPDFHVEFNKSLPRDLFGREIGAKKWMVEIKYEKDLNIVQREEPWKYEAAAEHCELNGMEFHVFTEEIRGAYLENLKFLSRYQQFLTVHRNDSWQSDEYSRICDYLSHHDHITANLLKEIAKNREDLGNLIRALWTMVSIGSLHTDLNISLNNNTIITAY